MNVRTAYFLVLFFIMAAGTALHGQQKKTSIPGSNAAAKTGARKLLIPDVFLGTSAYTHTCLPVSEFETYMRQGLTSRDSSGNKYKVVGFEFGLLELRWYEDEVGNPMKMKDYSGGYCNGDTLPANIVNPSYDNDSVMVVPGLYKRMKPGDTLYFDKITVVRYKPGTNTPMPDSTAIGAKGMKFGIVK